MDANMLTEDIDASLRATRRGAKIGFSSFLRSSEEAPHTERTLRKQRLRWAQGWTEVSLKHLIPILLGRRTSMRQKFGAFLLLGCAAAAVMHACTNDALELRTLPMAMLASESTRANHPCMYHMHVFAARGAAVAAVVTTTTLARSRRRQGRHASAARGTFAAFAVPCQHRRRRLRYMRRSAVAAGGARCLCMSRCTPSCCS